MTDASPWWTPHVHADRRPRLMLRNAIAAAIRDWFARRDFVEVETAALQVSPGNEAHLSAFATEAIAAGRHAPAALSPHLAGIRLQEAARGRRDQRFSASARSTATASAGPLHHPEFTMLEWYRAGETYESLMRDCAELLALAAERAGATRFAFRGREADPFAEPERLTVADALHAPCRHRPARHGRRRRQHRPRGAARGRGRGRPAHGARRQLGRSVQPGDGGARRAGARARARHHPLRISDLGGGPCPAERRRSAGGRALRALLLRRRARQRLRRTDRPRRAAPALCRRDGREGSASMASAIRSTRISSPRWPSCRRRAARHSASTGW